MRDMSPVVSDLVYPADINDPLERLRAGEPFVELQHDSVATRAATLDALLHQVAETETKLVWIGNPLRAPLTIERVVLQAAGPEADLRVERTPAELVAMLQSAADGAVRCLMIVQQPETLDPEARETLARMAPLLTQAAPTIQFLFCGTTAFRPVAEALPALAYRALPEHRSATREKLPMLLLLVVAILGTVFTSTAPEKPVPVTTLSSAEPVVTPRVDEPRVAAVPPITVPEPPAQPPKVDVATLRREFDAFLAQQPPRTARLSPEQRDALFDEFLARQQKRASQPKT